MAASTQVTKDTNDSEHGVNNNGEAMFHRINSTDSHDGSKDSMLKRIATLERELEIKNREITSLQEACKKSNCQNDEVQEATDKLAVERKQKIR